MYFISSLDESSKRWLQSLSRTLSNIPSQSGPHSLIISKLQHFENLNSSPAATQNMSSSANLSAHSNYLINSSNTNSMMNMNNIPALNQIYDGYFYNANMNNINGFIPNDQNGSNMFYGNNNYYIPMTKMYPNSNSNPPYGINSINHAVNAGNSSYSNNVEKKF